MSREYMLIIFFVDVTFVRRVSRSHAIATAPIYISHGRNRKVVPSSSSCITEKAVGTACLNYL